MYSSYLFATSAETAEAILKNAQNAQTVIADAMNGLWENTFGESSAIFLPIFNLALVFAVACSLLLFVQLAKAWMEDDGYEAWDKLFWCLIIIIFLASNGYWTKQGILALRGIVNNLNESLIANVSATVGAESAYTKVMEQLGVQSQLEAQKKQCYSKTDLEDQIKCFKQVEEAAQELSKKHGGNWITGFIDGVKNAATNPIGALGNAATGTLEMALQGWLLAFGIAFQWLVEITLILTSLLAPLAMAGSLLPMGQKSIFTWLIGFFSVAFTKICFNLINAFVASLALKAEGAGDIVFAFATGLLSPILATSLAAGGGMATLSTLGSMAGKAAQAGLGAATTAASPAIGAAGKAAKRSGIAAASGVRSSMKSYGHQLMNRGRAHSRARRS